MSSKGNPNLFGVEITDKYVPHGICDMSVAELQKPGKFMYVMSIFFRMLC